MTRDQFLTKKMGDRWHVPDYYSTWEGFGKLWEWAKEQEWWLHFAIEGINGDFWIQTCFINPDTFANSIAKYLGWEADHD